MDPAPSSEIIQEIPGIIQVYKDGRFQKFLGADIVPVGVDSNTGVQSKDVVISPETGLSVRIYNIPNSSSNIETKKLPIVIFFHGGGFIIESAKSPTYHNFLNLVTSESKVVVVSVDYRTAPEHFIPTCYDDSWEAIEWVRLHVNGNGPDPWLNECADFENLFFVGDSAGGNIAHHMAIRVGLKNPDEDMKLNLRGMILLHPYFWGKDPIGSESDEHPMKNIVTDLWLFAHPGTSGLDDPLINPDKDPNVSGLGCSRILVCVAEKDILKDRGWFYRGILGKNGWKGDIQVIEDKGMSHVFFLISPTHESASTLRKRISTFINQK